MVSFAQPQPAKRRTQYVVDEDGVQCGSFTQSVLGGIEYEIDGVVLLRVLPARDGIAAAAIGPNGKPAMLLSVPTFGPPSVMDLRDVGGQQ
jgi:hypothetical protein